MYIEHNNIKYYNCAYKLGHVKQVENYKQIINKKRFICNIVYFVYNLFKIPGIYNNLIKIT